MENIGGTPTPATNDTAANRDRLEPGRPRRRRSILPTLLGSLVALLLIAGAFYYFAGRDGGTEIASRQPPEQVSERPPATTTPPPTKSTENPPSQTASPATPASPQSPSPPQPTQQTQQQQPSAPTAPSAPTQPANQAQVQPSTPPAAGTQEPAPMSDRATALPGSEETLFVQRPRVNIRSEPRTGRVIGTATKGSQVKVVGRSGNWVEVESDAGKGWISRSLLSPSSSESR